MNESNVFEKQPDTNSRIYVASCTIRELFSIDEKPLNVEGLPYGLTGELDIPEYQRPYVWGDKEIERLLDDIMKYQKNGRQSNKPMFYLGSVILHAHDGKLSIIDGQQRLTTLAVIQHIVADNKVPKLRYASPKTIKGIKHAHKRLEPERNQSLKDFPFEMINVTLVITNSEDEAYTFFETQNTGGVPLSGVHIIKAHHLRVIPAKGKKNEDYAVTWEGLKQLPNVIELLIKARRWNSLQWLPVPSRKDRIKTKAVIIEDFSERMLPETKGKFAYPYIEMSDEYMTERRTPFILAVRQPLSSGENFVDYLKQFSDIYYRLFIANGPDADIPAEYFKFRQTLICPLDGTAYIKELFEIVLMCYVNKFGIKNLFEASLWIFRSVYRLRLNLRVIEASISKDVKENTQIIDVVLSCFSHEELVERLKAECTYHDPRDGRGREVRKRFVNRCNEYFKISIGENGPDYCSTLATGIDMKLKSLNTSEAQ